MKLLLSFVALVALLVATTVNAHAVPKVYDVSTKRQIEYKQFIDSLKSADAVFIGETHDEKKQHQDELEIIRNLSGAGKIAIGLEMFTTDNQQQLDDWVNGKTEEARFKEIYAQNWSYDWSLYRDIFIYARDNHIPMIALNVPKRVVSKVVRQGAAALDESEKLQIPRNVNWTLNAAQTEYLKKITAQVFGNRPVPLNFSHFAQAQALRNSQMSWSIARYHKKSPKDKIVVLSGTWHAIRNGAPDELKQYGLTSKVVLPELAEFVIGNATTDEADYFILK